MHFEDLHTILQVIATNIFSSIPISICNNYCSQILYNDLDNITAPFILMGDFNVHLTSLNIVQYNARGRIREELTNN